MIRDRVFTLSFFILPTLHSKISFFIFKFLYVIFCEFESQPICTYFSAFILMVKRSFDDEAEIHSDCCRRNSFANLELHLVGNKNRSGNHTSFLSRRLSFLDCFYSIIFLFLKDESTYSQRFAHSSVFYWF